MYKSGTCDLFKYLKTHKKVETTKNGKKVKLVTNTSMSGGAYFIGKKEYKDFLSLYAAEIERKRYNFHLTEKFNDISSVVIDVDMKFTDSGKSKITDNIIQKIAKLHIDYISKHFVSGKRNKNYTCLVFTCESNPYYDNKSGKYKDGIHLQFPYIRTSKKYKITMRQTLKQKVFDMCASVGNVNPANDLYDNAIARHSVAWCLYGSAKPGKKPYQVYSVYRPTDGKIITLTNKFLNFYSTRKLALIKLLSVHIDKEMTPYKNADVAKELEFQYNKYYTQVMSKIVQREEKMFMDCSNKYRKVADLEDYEVKEIRDLVMCLNPKRAINYEHWLFVGLILHGLSKDLLFIWKEFSMLCPEKYDDDVCESKWASFSTDSMGQILQKGSLRLWAREDNPEKYKELVTRHVFDMVKQVSQRINHNDTAVVLKKMYGREIVCSIDRKVRKWYIFDHHKWCEKDPILHLRRYMSNQVVKECNKVIEFTCACFGSGNMSENQKEREVGNVKLLTNHLKTTAFKNSVIKECESVFAEDGFHLDLDTNKWLLGINNGVYDLRRHICRDGVPEDKISLSANVSYDPKAKSEELQTFLDQILPIPELKTFVLKVLSLTLTGVFLQRLFIFIGLGSNGKNTLLDLVEELLGSDFFASVHHSVLTKGRTSSSGPSPDIAKTKGKRLIFMEEPDTRDRLNVGQIKWLTGGGQLAARFLNENEIEFRPHYKIIFLVNNEPHIDSTDYGTWRRILCVPFISKFMDNPDPDREFEFKINRYVHQNFTDWVPAFFNILIEHLKLFQKEGLRVPEIVIQHTQKFKSACDYIFAFTNTNIIKTDNPKDIVSFPIMYKRFDIWYRQNRGSKAPEPRVVKKLMEANYFKTDSKMIDSFEEGWQGFKLRSMVRKTSDDDDDDEGEDGDGI